MTKMQFQSKNLTKIVWQSTIFGTV